MNNIKKIIFLIVSSIPPLTQSSENKGLKLLLFEIEKNAFEGIEEVIINDVKIINK